MACWAQGSSLLRETHILCLAAASPCKLSLCSRPAWLQENLTSQICVISFLFPTDNAVWAVVLVRGDERMGCLSPAQSSDTGRGQRCLWPRVWGTESLGVAWSCSNFLLCKGHKLWTAEGRGAWPGKGQPPHSLSWGSISEPQGEGWRGPHASLGLYVLARKFF